MKKFFNNHKGVTMIEVLVTVAILAIVVAPCLSAFVMAQRGNVKAAETQATYTAAANLIEELKGIARAEQDDAEQDDAGQDVAKRLAERLDDNYTVDGTKVNQNDGVHVVYKDCDTYWNVWVYAGEDTNLALETDDPVPDGYILKGVIAP